MAPKLPPTATLASLPTELLVQIFEEAFPAHERFHFIEEQENPPYLIYMENQERLVSIINNDGNVLPPRIKIKIDPLQAAYFEVYKSLPAIMRFRDPKPSWLYSWGPMLTRLLQHSEALRTMVISMPGAAFLPAISVTEDGFSEKKAASYGNCLDLPHLTTLYIDAMSKDSGLGGILDTGGMLLRSCPNLERLMVSNVDLVIPPPQMKMNDANKGRFVLAATKPVKLENTTTKEQRQEAAARDAEPPVFSYKGRIPEGCERADPRLRSLTKTFTGRTFINAMLPWASTLKTLRVTVQDDYEFLMRMYEVHGDPDDIANDVPSPLNSPSYTELLTKFSALEHLELHTSMFDGLHGAEAEQHNTHDLAFDPQEAHNRVRMSQMLIPSEARNIYLLQGADRTKNDFIWGAGGSSVVDEARAFAEKNPGASFKVVTEDTRGLKFDIGTEDTPGYVYKADRYVSDGLVRLLPQTLKTLTLHTPHQESAWFGYYSCRPAILGLLRAVRRGEFPHLTHIRIDPDYYKDMVSLDMPSATASVGSKDVRTVELNVRYASYYIDESKAPRKLYLQARKAYAAEKPSKKQGKKYAPFFQR
ncbi:hypothetical protein SBRCBS47491_003461 [Sporothrix bragantina]|uniref:Uncharacterized protein n=1 Tax=Sporothrix bragantina TaxID=671064 RepID=A0ABP0BGD0_9PEZI